MEEKEKIILFGASKLGEVAKLYFEESYNILYFVDNDCQKWGEKFQGIEVIPPDKLKNFKDTKVIITSIYEKEISEQLINMGIENIQSFFIGLNNYDKEIMKISKIISSSAKAYSINEDIFIDRLEEFPQALKMDFWEKHFELIAFEQYSEISGNILDFGCGSGHLDIYLARKGKVIHGVDLSPIAISIANFLREQETEEIKKNVSFSQEDITKPKIENIKYDSVWASNVFEHILEPGPILGGLRNWVKPNAFILIAVPLKYAYDDPDHVHHFMNKEDLRNHLCNYINIVKIDTDEKNQMLRALCRF